MTTWARNNGASWYHLVRAYCPCTVEGVHDYVPIMQVVYDVLDGGNGVSGGGGLRTEVASEDATPSHHYCNEYSWESYAGFSGGDFLSRFCCSDYSSWEPDE